MNSNTLTLQHLNVRGMDAQKFLQGMLTIDVVKLQPNESKMAAACNRKGRVVANFVITKNADTHFALLMPAEIIAVLATHLKKFVIAAKVEFITDATTTTIDLLNEIKNETPHILLATSELFTPQMLNLDKLNAVDFKKGCYVGQEIVARTQHLGKLKRHLHGISLPLDTNKKPGDEFLTPDNLSGTIVNVAIAKNTLLALAVIKDQ